jgi:hypothetical protein
MDNQAFERDLRKAAKMLPPSVQEKFREIAAFVFTNLDTLQRVMPALAPIMMPHVQTVMFEGATGILDKQGLEAAVRNAFSDIGVNVPVGV